MGRIYLYNELGEDEPSEITEDQILKLYYPYWSKAMLKRGGLSPRITEANCILDFVIVNWCWEKEDA